MAKLHRLALLILFLLALPLLAGCPDDDDDFDRNAPDDDDDDDIAPDDDDDDSAEQNNTPPTITIASVIPDIEAGELLEGDLQVNFFINDPDSAGFEVLVEFSVDGVDGTFNTATLDDDNPYEDETGSAPLVNHPGTIVWTSNVDIPTIAEEVAVKLCATDSEGNSSPAACVFIEASTPVDNTGTNDLGAFCQPGHLEGQAWINGEAIIPLSDGECLNYQKTDPPAPDDFSSQFLLVLVNPEAEDAQFTVSPIAPPEQGDDDDDDSAPGDDDDDSAPAPPPPQSNSFRGGGSYAANSNPSLMLTQPVRSSRTQHRNPLAFGEYISPFGNTLPDRAPLPALTCEPDLGPGDLHNDPRNFEFRDTIMEGSLRSAVGADLRALGEYVAIYVDDEVPIDFDEFCDDDTNTVVPDDLPAFGFTNCDLEGVVDVFDNNIWPTLTTLYGIPSDVDNNCRVTVLLSHRLNSLTLTNGDTADDKRLVKSFAEPEIDLWASDLDLNPNSNEEEMLFLYAADPVGFWNDQTVPLVDYLNFEVNGRMAVALQDLISYSVHRQVEKTLLDPAEPTDIDNPPAEEDWLNDSMGLLAADVTGFGAISYWDAWIYMDRSHLLSLLSENTLEDFEDRGGQYVFARYLYDLYGDAFIYDVINAEDTQGLDTITAVLEANGYTAGDDDDEGEEIELFDAFALDWATAMAVSGRLNEANGQLVPDTVVPNFHEPGQVLLPDPAVPVPGQLYGAHGFQTGFDVRGPNVIEASGFDTDTDDTVAIFFPENLDPLLFHPQEDFYGTIKGFYGVAVVKISGLEQPVNYIKIETSNGTELLGNVIRINDSNPHNPLLTLEDVSGAKITTARRLDTGDEEFGESLDTLLANTGGERNVIGVVDEAQTITLSESEEPPDLGDDDDEAPSDDDDTAGDDDDDDTEVSAEITDTDRYIFTLDAKTTLGIWVDRRIADLTGAVTLGDPFLAVAPVSDVPDAFDYEQWNFGPTLADGPCGDASLYSYPVVMPDWLAPQANLISNPTMSGTFDPIVEPEPEEGDDDDDSAGPTVWPCQYDHDQDLIPDIAESAPGVLSDQIRLRQAQNLLEDPEFYEDTFGSTPEYDGLYNFAYPWFDEIFIDIDSNEDPDDAFATAIPEYNLGGRAAETGEEAVWMGTLPAGDYIIIVGGVGGAAGPYDLSVKLVQ
ncbi:MAG: hypothetical protein GY898_26085 [Proteobacteria bacterium]|nr:hypothetical protein [Pseudomonadota bacterium]